MKPLLIVMLTYNSYATTACSIRSVLDNDYKDARGEPLYDLLLVDDHGADDSFERLRAEFPAVRTARNTGNPGYAGGNNTGLRIAIEEKYPLVCLVSNDTMFDPSCFRRLANVFAYHPHVGFAGPKVYYYDYRGKHNVFHSAGCWVNVNKGRAVSIGDGEEDRGQHDQCGITGYVNGCCIMMRSRAIEKIGLLDETMIIWEETDLCERGRRAHYESVYVPDAKMWHHDGGTGNPYWQARNKFRYLKKYATPKQYRRALCWFIVDEAPKTTIRYLIIRRDPRRMQRFVKGTVDGMIVK